MQMSALNMAERLNCVAGSVMRSVVHAPGFAYQASFLLEETEVVQDSSIGTSLVLFGRNEGGAACTC